MYRRHFGFSRPLFADGVAQDDFVFRNEAAERTARDLIAALSRSDAVVILSGASGTGKTTLAADALKSFDTRLAFTCISQAPLTAEELLEQLLTDFGFEPAGRSRVERLQLWRQFLSEMTATGSRVCVLVESADIVPEEVLQALHALTAADASLSRGANVVLTTPERPENLLSTPAMRPFNQRVCLRRRLAPLTEDEVLAFLQFRIRQAGARPEQILGPDVSGLLHEYSGGIIRVIDNLLESVLREAAAAAERSLTAMRVIEVAEQRFGLTRLDPAAVDELLSGSAPPAAPGHGDDIPTLTEPDEIPALPDLDDIPTLTEVLALAPRALEIPRAALRTARR